jgi:hypothetical protein
VSPRGHQTLMSAVRNSLSRSRAYLRLPRRRSSRPPEGHERGGVEDEAVGAAAEGLEARHGLRRSSRRRRPLLGKPSGEQPGAAAARGVGQRGAQRVHAVSALCE